MRGNKHQVVDIVRKIGDLTPYGVRRWAGLIVALLLLCVGSTPFFAAQTGAYHGAQPLTVVIDDNYPPFIFRNDQGELRGLRKDMWDLWSDKTGIPVVLKAMDWNEVLKSMAEGQADVIDTVFKTEARQQVMDYSAPYFSVDVPIFFNRDLSGIRGVDTLRGFTIGAKAGDACISWLKERGIGNIHAYNSFESLTDAAIRREVLVYCLDLPAALYFLIKSNHEDDFRHTEPLYTGQLHWAVRKGNAALLTMVADGFAKISKDEELAIQQRWFGQQLSARLDWQKYGRWLLLSVALLAVLGVWNWLLRRLVGIRTRALAESNTKLDYLAHHDLLTGLPNRLLLRTHLLQAKINAKLSEGLIAFVLIDLDQFKTVNDSLGHAMGDALLKAIAEKLAGCIAAPNFVSREGGDEFLVLINDAGNVDTVQSVVTLIHQTLALPIKIDEHEFVTSISAGISLYPKDGEDFDTLLKKADMAMYQAKAEGRNTYRFFTEQLTMDVVAHLAVCAGLRQALKLGEFELYFQPQFRISTGEIAGVEALIRWNHPERGLVPPVDFISIAEESGLILPIGDWVLREACRLAAQWQRNGTPIPVAVNLSPLQFRRSGLANIVQQALEESGLSADLLELELTESILIQHTEEALETVREIKALGVKLSIDDFGTGYSSLAYIKRLTVDKLKIDQSFVRDMHNNPDNAAITSAVIQMARSMNLVTIAEGVDKSEVLDELRRLNCDFAQGFLLARPMPASQLFPDAVKAGRG